MIVQIQEQSSLYLQHPPILRTGNMPIKYVQRKFYTKLKRELIRHTWGSAEQLKIFNGKLVFAIGEFSSEKVQTEIIKESQRSQLY